MFEACRLGILKPVSRRLNDSERAMFIKSGSVFVWQEADVGTPALLPDTITKRHHTGRYRPQTMDRRANVELLEDARAIPGWYSSLSYLGRRLKFRWG